MVEMKLICDCGKEVQLIRRQDKKGFEHYAGRCENCGMWYGVVRKMVKKEVIKA